MSVPVKAAGSALALLFAVIVLIVLGPTGAAGEEAELARAEHDLVLIGKDATLSGGIAGDVQVLGGSLVVNAPIEGDLIAIAASVEFGPSGRVGRSLIVLGGSVRGLTRERVGGEIWAPSGVVGALGQPRSGEALVAMLNEPFSLAAAAIKLALTLFWLAVAVPIAALAGREVRAASLEVKASLFHSFLLGLVAFTSFVLTAVVFSYLVPYGIGVVLLAILGAVALAVKVFGMVALFHATGMMLAGPRTHEDARRGWRRGDLVLTILGALTFGALRLVPVVGNVIWMAASIVGIGVALATGFGRREPWFLTVRSEAATD